MKKSRKDRKPMPGEHVDTWMTVTEYAKIKGLIRNGVYHYIREGRVRTKTVHGLTLVKDYPQ